MRLNRGTIILLVAALAVIVIVAVLNNNQANTPTTPTPTPGVERVALFPETTVDTITQVEVVDNNSGLYTRLTKDAGGAWDIDATNRTDRAADQDAITSQVTTLIALRGENTFEVEEARLVDFGLDMPDYVITVTAGTTEYTLYVGNINPTGNRFYTVVETGTVEPTPEATVEATAEATPESTAEAPTAADSQSSILLEPPVVLDVAVLTGNRTVHLVARETINALRGYINAPPYVPPPTATPTPTATLNPLSEVQLATMTAEFEATQMADILATVTAMAAETTPEATAEATAEATPDASVSGGAEATPEATAEVTPEATEAS